MSPSPIKTKIKIDVSSIKRCYGEGKIEANCPKCGQILKYDFEQDYLSHPNEGEDDELYFYCSLCGVDLKMPIYFGECVMDIEYFPGQIEEDV